MTDNMELINVPQILIKKCKNKPYCETDQGKIENKLQDIFYKIVAFD